MQPISHSRPARAAAGLLGLVALAGWVATSQAGDSVSAADDPSRPFLVKIHADWCGTCTRMTPAFEALEQKVGSDARIVVLDVTDKDCVAASRAEAQRLGMVAFFDQYKRSTGSVGVLRGDTREVVEVIKGSTDPARYLTALDRARASS